MSKSCDMSCTTKSLPADAQLEVALENMFTSIAKSGDPKADGQRISQAAVEQWVTKVENKIVIADVETAFQKLRKPTINFTEFTGLINELAKVKGLDEKVLKDKLIKM